MILWVWEDVVRTWEGSVQEGWRFQISDEWDEIERDEHSCWERRGTCLIEALKGESGEGKVEDYG